LQNPYKKVAELTKKVKDKENHLFTDAKQVQQRWKEYVKELYDKKGKPEEKKTYLEKITQETERTTNSIL